MTVRYLSEAGSTSLQSFRAFRVTSNPDAAVIAATGDLTGDGGSDLVLGQSARSGSLGRDSMEVYRIQPGESPQQVAHFSAFRHSTVSDSSNFRVGDVEPWVPGEEIVVGEDGSRRPATRVRIFGGLGDGQLQLLANLRVLPRRAAARRPLGFALGDVDPDSPGQEIIVADRFGNLWVHGLGRTGKTLLRRIAAFPDLPATCADHLAVGDVLPDVAGNEIVVADDGTRGDGLVRVIDGRSGALLLEFTAFPPNGAPDGVSLWVADVLTDLPGAEVIVGQGDAGGQLRIFSLAEGVPRHVLDLPDSLQRTTSLQSHLAVGELLPDAPGNQVAVAQMDTSLPVEVFHFEGGEAQAMEATSLPAAYSRRPATADSSISTVVVGR